MTVIVVVGGDHKQDEFFTVYNLKTLSTIRTITHVDWNRRTGKVVMVVSRPVNSKKSTVAVVDRKRTM